MSCAVDLDVQASCSNDALSESEGAQMLLMFVAVVGPSLYALTPSSIDAVRSVTAIAVWRKRP